MDRIGPAGGSPTVALTNGQLGAVDENLSTGQEGTVVPALWGNAITEELMSILAAAGTTPNINNWGQVLSSLKTLFGGLSGGSGDNSFLYLPNGWILQVGNGVLPASGNTSSILSVTFPLAFPSICRFAGGTAQGYANNTYSGYPAISTNGAPGLAGATFVGDTLTGLEPSANQILFNRTCLFNYIAVGQ